MWQVYSLPVLVHLHSFIFESARLDVSKLSYQGELKAGKVRIYMHKLLQTLDMETIKQFIYEYTVHGLVLYMMYFMHCVSMPF